jgi:AraC-like DNA-binding protein
MTAQYALSSGQLVSFKPGLPTKFNGPLLPGIETFYSNSASSDIVIQEYLTDYLSFRNVHIRWKSPGSIICRYDYGPSLFSRAAISNDVREHIKGAGRIHVKNNEFAILTGSRWTGLLIASEPCDQHFIDIGWSAEALENVNTEYPDVHDLLQHVTDGLPDRVKGPFRELDTYMQRVLEEIFQINFFEESAAELFESLLERYLNLILRESKEFKTVRKKVREHFDNILKAQTLIEEHTDKHFTIPQISSLVGLNEYKLKMLFPVVTGFNVDEYRKYLLCSRVAKKIVQRPDTPLKNFYAEAGYSSETTFVRGFKKICCCTPGELRGDEWDVEAIVGDVNR